MVEQGALEKPQVWRKTRQAHALQVRSQKTGVRKRQESYLNVSRPIGSDRSGTAPVPSRPHSGNGLSDAELILYEWVAQSGLKHNDSRRGLASAMLFYMPEGKTMRVKTNMKSGLVVIAIIAPLISLLLQPVQK